MMPSVPTPWPGPVNAKSRDEADTGDGGSEPPEPVHVLPKIPGVVVVARVELVFGPRLVVVMLFAGSRAVVVGTVVMLRCT